MATPVVPNQFVVGKNRGHRMRSTLVPSTTLALSAGVCPQARCLAQRRTPQGLGAAAAMERIRRRLAGADDGNRQMVDILIAVLADGLLPAVEAA